MIDEKSALLYAKLNSYKFLVEKTERFIAWALGQVRNVYVACSFGKDSSVLLDLVLKQLPDIVVVWITFPETTYLNNYYEVADWWVKNKNINLREIYIDIPADQPFDDKQAFPQSPFDGYFIGITKEESASRRISLSYHGLFYKNKNSMVRIAPLADWQVQDIAAYCVANKLPLLNSYKTEGFYSRTVTGFTEDIYAYRLNQLTELKNRDIQAYNQMIQKWPGLKNYV